MSTTGKKKKTTIKNSNIWRLNNTLLNKQQITEEIKICIETNENENITTQNLWDTIKVVLDRKSTRLNSSHTDSSRMPSSA